MGRPSSDELWMGVAEQISQRSQCVRSQVGCVLIDTSGRVVATGYNGPPATWYPHVTELQGQSIAIKPIRSSDTCESFCPRGRDGGDDPSYANCPSIHAEMNALMYSDRRLREGGTMYVTRAPCFHCAKAVANSGLRKIYAGPVPLGYDQAIYDEVEAGLRLLEQCGMSVLRWQWKT